MQPKEALEKLAKDNAFEYDLQWWNNVPRKRMGNATNGDIVAFYRSHHVFNGVVALWARNNSHAVLFYTTPHDVADELKYGWIPPIFRVEVSAEYVFRVPTGEKKAFDPESDEAESTPTLSEDDSSDDDDDDEEELEPEPEEPGPPTPLIEPSWDELLAMYNNQGATNANSGNQ